MIPYLAVFAIAAIVTVGVTPLVARLARRVGAVDEPGDERKIHERPTPTLGGLAMLLGFLGAVGLAWAFAAFGLDASGPEGESTFAPIFSQTSEPLGLLGGIVLIVALGLYDDLRGLPAPLKLAGQLVAALPPVLLGIQLVYAWIPGLGVLVLSPDLGIPLTVLVIVAMINAVNLIDGLDGLAAGVVAIAATAFFAFAYGSDARGIAEAAPTSALLVAAALAGVTLGFLVHNFHPADIFMGDTGSMLLGLLLASSGVAFVGRTTDPGYTDFAGVFPLAIPALVLGLAFLDTGFAVVRRLYHKRPLASPDREHIHHRLLHVGVGQKRVVLTMYYWSAVVAFGAVGVTYLTPLVMLVVVAGLIVLGVVLTSVTFRGARNGDDPETAEVAGRRSG
ncbi:MAG: undecaprenyl/decaprenyl-phosphate alpha-N-acetylglucosaminyl 1-phosphate transferase [Actinobacteria bacterium]|nr:undecaprenyl/decaprenyl-phosphate alpha-N-acetylglucosaminyl 1-phosphate transferase [Actinomycetota bacterium]